MESVATSPAVKAFMQKVMESGQGKKAVGSVMAKMKGDSSFEKIRKLGFGPLVQAIPQGKQLEFAAEMLSNRISGTMLKNVMIMGGEMLGLDTFKSDILNLVTTTNFMPILEMFTKIKEEPKLKLSTISKIFVRTEEQKKLMKELEIQYALGDKKIVELDPATIADFARSLKLSKKLNGQKAIVAFFTTWRQQGGRLNSNDMVTLVHDLAREASAKKQSIF